MNANKEISIKLALPTGNLTIGKVILPRRAGGKCEYKFYGDLRIGKIDTYFEDQDASVFMLGWHEFDFDEYIIHFQVQDTNGNISEYVGRTNFNQSDEEWLIPMYEGDNSRKAYMELMLSWSYIMEAQPYLVNLK